MRIFFFFDLCRNPFDKNSVHTRYAMHIKNLFEWQIYKISNYKIKFTMSSLEEENGFCRKKFYSLMNIEYNEENWPKIYSAKPTKEAIKYVSQFVSDNCLIISYEISPIFTKIFNNLNLDYLDLRVSPIKYLDDLVLGFKTSNKKIFDKLLAYKVSENQFKLEASLLKSRNILVNARLEDIKPKSAVFAGQMKKDASMIKDGKVLSILDYEDKFKQKTEEFDTIYYKKHPSEREDSLNYKFVKSFKNVEVVNTNIYHLMSCDNIKEFFAISSGTSQEAEFFGKKSDCFYKSIYQFIRDGETKFSSDKYISVYRKYFEPNFWADILGPIMKTKKVNDIEIAPNQSRMRYLHNIYWGYKDLIKNNNTFYNDAVNNNQKLLINLEKKIKKIDERRIIKKINLFVRKIKNILQLKS